MSAIRLGIRENLPQFSLLVVVNALVGAMIGMERSILPAIAEQDFHLAARTAVLSFIVVFGVTKALTNYLAGRLSDRFGRKPVLVGGWIIAAPVPFLLMWAPSWGWVLFANLLLGVSQGLTWSTTVIMKIDLAGPQKRGLAMGLNEFAGYFAVAASALATGWIAARYGLRPEPFYLGIGFVAVGIGVVIVSNSFAGFATGAALLGIGTAMVYPTLLAAIGDVAHPSWRASSVGVYRLWRDLGYAIGALLAGLTADALGLPAAMWVIAALTFGSGLVVALRMSETLRGTEAWLKRAAQGA